MNERENEIAEEGAEGQRDPESVAAEVLRQRELAYRLFASLFGTEVTNDFLREASQARPPLEGRLGEYLASLPSDQESLSEARDKTVAEFSRLFLNMSSSPVFLYESAYTSPEGLLMQDSRDQVLSCYRQSGFSLAQALKLPEDHLSFELEFMAELCSRELSCMSANDEEGADEARQAQEGFLANHLLPWVFKVCNGVDSMAKTGLYLGVSEALRSFMEMEANYSSSRSSSPKPPS